MKDNLRTALEATRYSLGAIFLLGVLFAAPAFAAGNLPDAGMPLFPALTGPVVDEAKLLPPDANAVLAQKLAQYASETGTQLVVVTLPTLNSYPIEHYGYELGRHWGIGEKGKNTGALLIVDKDEQQAAHRSGLRPGRRPHGCPDRQHHPQRHRPPVQAGGLRPGYQRWRGRHPGGAGR